MRYALILAACLVTPCSAQEPKPVSDVQVKIDEAAKALLQSRGLPHLHAETAKQLSALNELVPDKAELVNQLAVFAAGIGEQRSMMALAVLQSLKLPPSVIIRVLAPYLDDENPKIRSFVRDWFQSHDNGGADESALKPVNFEDYAKYVREQQGNVPAPFVEYIYERSPYRALLVFSQSDRRAAAIAAVQAEAEKVEAARQGREVVPEVRQQRGLVVRRTVGGAGPAAETTDNRGVVLAVRKVETAIWCRRNGLREDFQQVLPEVKEQLTELAEHDQWWVRRYVAEIMRRHPELRVAEVIEKLSNDDNESVNKAAKSVKG